RPLCRSEQMVRPGVRRCLGRWSGQRWVRNVKTPRFLADGGEPVEEGRGGRGAIPGADQPAGGAALLEAGGVPAQDQIVDDARQRSGARDGLGRLVLGILAAEDLLLIVKRDLKGPAPSRALKDDGVVDGEVGAAE